MTLTAIKKSSSDGALAKLLADHNMPQAEYEVLLGILGREPTMAEFGVAAAMWSEHCSYKSTRVWLKQLPTTGPQVIYGPGENAGVVDIGDGLAAVFKIESHNHPSYIEPYQGAATGVGGILRDVFTMGARPVASLNALRFGDPKHPKTRSLVTGVVAGIGGYGNCVGVPTVGGEVNFHPSYNGNCLVNAMTVGIADKIGFLPQRRRVSAIRLSMLAPKRGAMASRAPPCRLANLIPTRKANAQPFRLATHSPKSF